MDLNAKLNQFGRTDGQTDDMGTLYVLSTFMAGHKKNGMVAS